MPSTQTTSELGSNDKIQKKPVTLNPNRFDQSLCTPMRGPKPQTAHNVHTEATNCRKRVKARQMTLHLAWSDRGKLHENKQYKKGSHLRRCSQVAHVLKVDPSEKGNQGKWRETGFQRAAVMRFGPRPKYGNLILKESLHPLKQKLNPEHPTGKTNANRFSDLSQPDLPSLQGLNHLLPAWAFWKLSCLRKSCGNPAENPPKIKTPQTTVGPISCIAWLPSFSDVGHF